MGLFSGKYSKDIYDPFKRYWGALLQESQPTRRVPWVDADFNDYMYNVVENVRRFRHEVFEDGTPGATHFLITESIVSNINNFLVDGGDGTVEGAGRYYVGGMTAVMPDGYEFDADSSTAPAAQMDFLHHRITNLTDTVLTDVDANYVVNELVGRDLIPKVDEGALVTRFAIISNTATTITVAGGLFAVASTGDFYMVALSTPAAAPATRTDTVYLDVYLDEENAVEDPDLLHAMAGVGTGVESCRRLKLVQQIHVYEGGTYAAGMLQYTSLAGNYHYRVPIAQLDRLALSNVVTAAMITDLRPEVTGYGSSHEVIEARDSTVYATVYDTLDDRLEFVEDDAKDAHDFIDTARFDGTYTGGVCTAAVAPGFVDYTAWTGSVGGEQLSIAGGTIDLGALAPGLGYVYVDGTGTVLAAALPPATGAILCRTEVAGGPLITVLRDWRFWINDLDNKNEIVVAHGAAPNRGNVSSLQPAIDYALARGSGKIRVKANVSSYSIGATITIADYGVLSPILADDLDITFEPGAVLEPSGDFAALAITNAERITIRGLSVLGTNLTNVTSMITVAGSTDVTFKDTYIDGASAAGDGFSLSACTRLRIDGLVTDNLLETGIQHTAGTTTDLHIDHADITATVDAITFGAGVVKSSSIRNTNLDGFSGFGIEVIAADLNIFIERVTSTGQVCAAVISSAGSGIHVSNVDVTSSSCSTAGIVFDSGSANSSLKDSYLYDITTGPAVLIDTVQSVVVADVYINQNSAAEYPISIDSSTHVTLQDVSVLNALAAGVNVVDSDYCTISKCRIQTVLRYGVYAENSPYLKVVDSNMIGVVQSGGNSTYVHLEGCSYSKIARNVSVHALAGVAYGVQTTDLATVPNVGVGIVDNVFYLGAGDFGVYLGGAGGVDSDMTVTGNDIEFSAAGAIGIFLNNVIESVIANNIVKTGLVGISVFGGTLDGTVDTTIRGNVLKDCGTGINIGGTVQQRVIIDGNIIDDPTVYGISGSILAGPLSVVNNTIDDATQDAIYFSGAGEKIHIANNSINSPGGYGIRLAGNNECSIIGNGLNGCGIDGIYLNGCDGTNVSTNRVTDSTVEGINVGGGGDDNTLTGNTCLTNGSNGILFSAGVERCVATGNLCRSNTGDGINLTGCLKSVVTGNNCSDNNEGIHASTATTYNVISGNVCCENTTHGIYSDGDFGSVTGNVCMGNGTLAGHYGIFLDSNSSSNACVGNRALNNGAGPVGIYNFGTGNGSEDADAVTNNCGTYNQADAVGEIIG